MSVANSEPDAERPSREQLDAVAMALRELRQQLRDLRPDAHDGDVAIVAVTKGLGAWAIEAAAQVGLVDVGENYAQELVRKAATLSEQVRNDVRFHFIGHLQTNKVRALAPLVHTYQSVDRPSLVAEIAKRAPSANVMIQLNLTGARNQGGCEVDSAADLVELVRKAGLNLTGAMAIGDPHSPTATRAAFGELADFADRHDLEHRSMGMSGDLAQALDAGSTMIRVGTRLFGARPQPRR